MKKIFVTLQTVGPDPESEIGDSIRDAVREESCPKAVTMDSVAWKLLEEFRLLDQYQSLKKDKLKYLEEIWKDDNSIVFRSNLALQQLAFDPLYARIVGWSLKTQEDEGTIHTKCSGMILDEVECIRSLSECLFKIEKSPENVWIGHGFKSFEMNTVLSSCVRHGVAVPSSFPTSHLIKEGVVKVYDISSEAYTTESKIPLDKLMTVYRVEAGDKVLYKKKAVTDDTIPVLYENKKIKEIGKYIEWKSNAIIATAQKMTFGWEKLNELFL